MDYTCNVETLLVNRTIQSNPQTKYGIKIAQEIAHEW